jgi:hypothetical protein
MRRIVLLALLAFPFAVLVGLLCLPECGNRKAPEEVVSTPAQSPVESPAPPQLPTPPRSLAITGLVLDADLRPAPNVEIRIGEETVAGGADGKFLFPPAVRTGRRPVSVKRDGKDVARWEEVVTGDVLADRGDPGEAELRPEMLRWTVNLVREPGAGAGAKRSGEGIEPIAALVQEWGAAGEILTLGRTTLPDRVHIDSSLSLEGDRLLASTERAEARGGAFVSRIQFPEGFRIHPGEYDLQLLFAVSLEDITDLERWTAERPSLEWNDSVEVSAVRKIQVGDRAEGREEDRKIDAYFRETLESIERLRKTITVRAQRARELAGSWDPQVIGAEVEIEKSSYGGVLDPSGKFDIAAWRRFLDEGWRPEVERLLAAHGARKTAGLSKFRRAENLLESVLKRILRFSQIESILVYQAWGLPIDKKDFYLDEEGQGGDRVIILQILMKDIALLRQFRSLDGAGDAGATERRDDQSSR